MIAINLLDNQRKEIVKRQEQAAKFNKLGFGVFGVVIMIFVGVFVLRFQMTGRLQDVKQEIGQKERQYASYEEVRQDSLVLGQKLTAASQVLTDRGVLKDKLALVFTLFNNNLIDLKEVGFGDTSTRSELELGGATASVSTYIDFTKDMDAYALDNELAGVTLSNLSRDKRGVYRFSYTLGFNTGGTTPVANAGGIN